MKISLTFLHLIIYLALLRNSTFLPTLSKIPDRHYTFDNNEKLHENNKDKYISGKVNKDNRNDSEVSREIDGNVTEL